MVRKTREELTDTNKCIGQLPAAEWQITSDGITSPATLPQSLQAGAAEQSEPCVDASPGFPYSLHLAWGLWAFLMLCQRVLCCALAGVAALLQGLRESDAAFLLGLYQRQKHLADTFSIPQKPKTWPRIILFMPCVCGKSPGACQH